ncbi:MAG: hypothetical protein WD991_01720 [Candidatus Paceibacterota bacterium]
MKINLIQESKSSLQDVVDSLTEQKNGTPWAEKTNQLAINYIIQLGDVYGDSWYKGFLLKETFLEILLPKHGHSMTEETVFFPLDTTIEDASECYKNIDSSPKQECWDAINYLKEDIRKNGFNSSLVVVVIGDKLKHVDGLHRMIALYLLTKEGFDYKSIPVFLCDSSKTNAKQ